MEKQKRPFDILRLKAAKLYRDYAKDHVEVEYTRGLDEDYLSDEGLISSGRVWDELWELKVRESDQIKFSDLYFCDRLNFMLWVRKRAYGQTFTQIVDESTKETMQIDLNAIKIPELDTAGMDENGFFSFVLPNCGKKLKYRLLTYKENQEALDSADSKMALMNLKVSPRTKEKLIRAIMEVDGIKDKSKISEFLESYEFEPSDSLALKEEMNRIMPTIDRLYEGLTNKGRRAKVMVNISASFFFPALFV